MYRVARKSLHTGGDMLNIEWHVTFSPPCVFIVCLSVTLSTSETGNNSELISVQQLLLLRYVNHLTLVTLDEGFASVSIFFFPPRNRIVGALTAMCLEASCLRILDLQLNRRDVLSISQYCALLRYSQTT
jgi:hypothetical protein